MTQNAMKIAARDEIANKLAKVLADNEAVQFGDASWAIRCEVDGQIIWGEVSVKSKQFTTTTRSEAFNPYAAQKKWLAEKKRKEEEKEEA